MPFEGVLVEPEAHKGTRRKHNMKFRQIGHTTIQSFFHKTIIVHGTCLPSLNLPHWLYLNQIFLTISVHPFRIIIYRRKVLRNNETDVSLTKIVVIICQLFKTTFQVNELRTIEFKFCIIAFTFSHIN